MKYVIGTLLILLFGTFSNSANASNPELLINLIEEGRIKIEATGTGTHNGESVKVMLTNTGRTFVRSSIPVGWVFISETPRVQDLLVVREEMFALSPGAIKSVICEAFCCESSGTGPEPGEHYRPGRMASPDLVAVAKACAAGEYNDHAIQHSIWVISDDHDIASMGAMDSTAVDSLRLAVSILSGQPVPLYSLRYAESEGSVCSGRPEWISRRLSIDLPNGATITVVAISHDSRVKEVLFDHAPLEPGHHELDLTVNVSDWPEGRYALRAHSNNEAGVRLMPFKL